MQPCAIGGTGHGQVQQLAGSTVADAINAVSHTDKAPLLLGLVLVLAQADGTGSLDAFHSLNDVAGVCSNGVEVICFDHSLCNSFHDLSLLLELQQPGPACSRLSFTRSPHKMQAFLFSLW